MLFPGTAGRIYSAIASLRCRLTTLSIEATGTDQSPSEVRATTAPATLDSDEVAVTANSTAPATLDSDHEVAVAAKGTAPATSVSSGFAGDAIPTLTAIAAVPFALSDASPVTSTSPSDMDSSDASKHAEDDDSAQYSPLLPLQPHAAALNCRDNSESTIPLAPSPPLPRSTSPPLPIESPLSVLSHDCPQATAADQPHEAIISMLMKVNGGCMRSSL